MHRLPRVLSSYDLPLAELHAARLDGDLARVGDHFCAIDEPDSIVVRAASLAVALPNRFIVERRSAAWVWGAAFEPPSDHDLCASLEARSRPQPNARINMREVSIAPKDLECVGGLLVTSPLRTLTDLARFPRIESWLAIQTMTRLSVLFNLSRDECFEAIEGRRNLPNVTLARRRISQCFASIATTGVVA